MEIRLYRYQLLGFALICVLGCSNKQAENVSPPQLQPDDSAVSLDIGEGMSLELIFIDGGKFEMGTDPTEPDHHFFDLEAREVQVEDFWMGRFEVTMGQYTTIMEKAPPPEKEAEFPILHMKWKDAIAFCQRVSRITGWNIRLPSEAEWEYACHKGSRRDGALGRVSKFFQDDSQQQFLMPIGSRQPNALGIYDMEGNVSELCQDRYVDRNWPDLSEVSEPSDQIPRVIKGGSWGSSGWACSRRYYQTDSNPDAHIGFRIVGTPGSD